MPDAPAQGQAKAAGTGGVEIALGPAGRVSGGPEQQQGEETPAEPEPEPVKETPPEGEPEPEPEPETQPEPEPEPVQESVTEAPEPAPPSREREKLAPPPQQSVAGAAGKSGTTEQDNTGSGDDTAGGGLPGQTRDYAATLLAWLEWHKEYPRRAQLRRQQGTVMLYFVVDRDGNVLEYRIHEESGYSALDEEVLAMIERAQPLPPMPEDLEKETLELIVPVNFRLR